jgi:hypothetical protein
MNVTNNILNANKKTPYLYAARNIYNKLPSGSRHNIWLTIEDRPNNTFKIQSHLGEDVGTELAYFSIWGTYCRAPFEKRPLEKCVPPSMNIDCSDYRGQRVSKMLMLVVFHFAKLKYKRFNEDSELYIDTDASDIVGELYCTSIDPKTQTKNEYIVPLTYWSAIGMTDNNCSEDHVSFGYEKRCKVKDLKSYLFRVT